MNYDHASASDFFDFSFDYVSYLSSFERKTGFMPQWEPAPSKPQTSRFTAFTPKPQDWRKTEDYSKGELLLITYGLKRSYFFRYDKMDYPVDEDVIYQVQAFCQLNKLNDRTTALSILVERLIKDCVIPYPVEELIYNIALP